MDYDYNDISDNSQCGHFLWEMVAMIVVVIVFPLDIKIVARWFLCYDL